MMLKKFALAVLLALTLGTNASSQVQDLTLYIASISPGGASVIADARFEIFRGDPQGIAATGTLSWQLEHCDGNGWWHKHTFNQSPYPYRVSFSLSEPGLYRIMVLQVELGLVANAYFRNGPLP